MQNNTLATLFLLLLIFGNGCSHDSNSNGGGTAGGDGGGVAAPLPTPAPKEPIEADCKVKGDCKDKLRNLTIRDIELIHLALYNNRTGSTTGIAKIAMMAYRCARAIFETTKLTHDDYKEDTFIKLFKELVSENGEVRQTIDAESIVKKL